MSLPLTPLHPHSGTSIPVHPLLAAFARPQWLFGPGLHQGTSLVPLHGTIQVNLTSQPWDHGDLPADITVHLSSYNPLGCWLLVVSGSYLMGFIFRISS